MGKKIQWGTPGGIPTARRAFYVGSVGLVRFYKTPFFCQGQSV